MDEIETVMHKLGTAFAAGLTQPGAMRASLTGNGHLSQTYDAAGKGALIGRWDARAGTDIDPLMRALRSATGLATPIVLELTGSPAGDYVVSYHAAEDGGDDLPALEPHVVLDADYRFPDHPGPGTAGPARPVDRGRPTDPAVLADVQGLVAQFIAEHTRLTGTAPRFAAGHREEEILAAEERLGARLPEDVRALYRVIHDDNRESGLLGRFSPVPLKQVVTWFQQSASASRSRDDDLFVDTPVVFETHPHGHVRRVSRSDWRVTFAPDYGMNYAALDLDPADAGEYGQILMFGRDVYGPVVHVAPSVRQLIRTVVAAMRAAAPEDGDWEPSEPPDPPDHAWYVDLGAADLAALAAAVADQSAVQFVHLRQADRVRLADLAELPHLRVIRVLDVRQWATEVDLSIPPGLPVEQVDVTAGHFDPALLAGTPTLRYLRLAGNTAPVRIAALAALPDLVRLDLAGAAVADVRAVATFPALRVLTLDATQWQDLLGTGWSPQRLAAARLGGPGGVPAAAAWRRAMSGAARSAAHHRTVSGPR